MEFADDIPRLVAEPTAGDNSAPVSVSELAGRLKRLVEGEFGFVRVRAEISGWKRAASGHAYLSLKDENAVIDAVMWKGQVARLPFAAQDGIEVIATGKLTIYPGRSKYQLVVETLELAGEGALMQLFERLKAGLAAEGLFDAGRKKSLPFMPATIGVVTSPTGAVIRDILHRLEDRCPTRVLVWPVKVQGDGAANEVAAAIRGFDALEAGGAIPRPDLIIVARGGGSIEDLWAFNEEPVVRAIAACSIPLISAVGHETDTSLADYAADLRAPTPTAAAEIAVPVRAELAERVASLALRTDRCQRRYRERARERLDALVRVLPRRDALLGPQRQRVDDAAARLALALERRAGTAQRGLDRAAGLLRPAMLDRAVGQARGRLEASGRLLASLHPDRPLARGYARVMARTTGKVVDSADAARAAGALTLHFRDGPVDATAGIASDQLERGSANRARTARGKVEPASGKSYGEGEPAQPSLL